MPSGESGGWAVMRVASNWRPKRRSLFHAPVALIFSPATAAGSFPRTVTVSTLIIEHLHDRVAVLLVVENNGLNGASDFWRSRWGDHSSSGVPGRRRRGILALYKP
jgi:hypothetical protein